MRILILDLDTLRPDHLGCYGYARDTSPNIDRVASQGVRFEEYYVSDAPCLPSRAALVSGRFGIHTGAVGHGGTAADFRAHGPERGFRDRLDTDSLWRIFRNQGLHTCSISPFAERHSLYPWLTGMNEVHNHVGKRGNESAEEVLPIALDWVERNASKEDWLLHVNLWDPHTPYRAPAEFGNPFADAPLPEWMTPEILAEHQQRVGPHGAREVSMYSNRKDPNHPRQPGEVTNMEEFRHLIDGYDCGIRFMDEKIGELLTALEAQGVMDDLAILITSDHGENMGELGIYAEHGTADYITSRIPMIMRWPGRVMEGHVDRGLHYNLDLLPTLAELLGQEPRASWDGQSYAASVTEGIDTGRDDLVLSQCCHICQRSVRFGPWLYMRTYHDGWRLWPQEMLFNVEDDPHEQHDLAADRPEICAEAAHRYLAWHDEAMATQLDGVTEDPMWTVLAEGGPFHAKDAALPSYVKFLKKTGREWAIPELQARHPGAFADESCS
jgi:choline-sulfatase